LEVNITAGTNLTMKEFEEVGSTVSDLASEDATVVMGTVIDPDLGDDLRVTVVATGLGEPVRSTLSNKKPVRLVANGTTGMPEMATGDDLPGEEQGAGGQPVVSGAGSKDLFDQKKGIDYLDIPSFLRTQAD
jgi:cell division protein FtsZ